MNVLELILRLLDKLIRSFQTKQAQKEQNDLEKNPANWFSEHFNGGVQDDPASKASKTNTKD
jgi:hypothetical protein